MSCTENESGPFVVFFLPAVVGCLTILLARRWANSQVTNTSSTAISRRRRIIKDPLIKRPLPQITKMVMPGSKKAVGVVKKVQGSIPDEETNGVSKRTGKRHSPSLPTGNAQPDLKVGSDGPVTPKHIPFPFIPQDGELLFESMSFVFTLVATGLQFLNLYRTVWWLPHSHTTQAMNFYLIDPHLVAFIAALLSRRFLMSATKALLQYTLAPKLEPHPIVAARMFILGVVLGAMAWCAYFIYLKFPPVKLFYLFYPAVIYFLLFGFQVSPFLELTPGNAPLHCCSHDQQHVKKEIDNMREDFNERLKRILFHSIIEAYYSSFVPLVFAQSYLYYDVYCASQQVALVWGGLCGRYCSQLLAAPYTDTAHRAAKHLLRYSHSPPAVPEAENPMSSESPETRLWSREPSTAHIDPSHLRFYSVFSNPSTMLCMLLCLQLSMIVIELCLLFSSIQWHNFIAIVMLLFINYYTLFKMVRDYLVSWKVYKAENMIQEKNYSLSYPQN